MSAAREPLIHVVKRDQIPLWRAMLIRVAAVLLSLIACAAIIYSITGQNPVEVYGSILDGAFGTSRRMWVTFQETAILLCVGLAVTPAFKMKFWNIGAEGQVLIGALATAAVMLSCAGLPAWLLYTLMVLAAVGAGIVWAVIPGVFKAFWNTNETLFTLMMNYVAIQLINFCVLYWENPKGSNTVGFINKTGKLGWLPTIFGNSYLLTILIILALMVLLYVYLRYSKQGYEIAVVGESERTARYAGINVRKVIIRTMAISGALCGITGLLLVSGSAHTISTNLAGGRGFTAIIVAWLGKLNPFIMLVVALLLVVMERGSIQIASAFNLNESASDIVLGVILFFVLGCEFFINYKLELCQKKTEVSKA